MGWLNRILGREERAQTFTQGGPVPEWMGLRTASGIKVNATAAENLGTVLACVNAISTALGSLPPYVYRQTGAGREELPGHPVARLTRAPWGIMTWPDWIEWCMGQVLLHGNALAEVVTDGAGRVTGLRPIPWHQVAPVMLPSGRLAFDVSIHPQPRRRLLDTEVFLLRDRSDDGLMGRSRISRAPDVIANAAALQDFAGHAWANQATPSGVVEMDARLDNPAFDLLRKRFSDVYSGTRNARRIMILDNKMTWKAMSVSPEDAEVLASRRFSVEELCRLFQVPPPIVQNYEFNTFTNSAQASLWFAQFSLAPWARKIEAEFSRSVFVGSDVSLEIDLSGLMRGDFETRWRAYEIARKNNILTTDEIREAEGYGPMQAADINV